MLDSVTPEAERQRRARRTRAQVNAEHCDALARAEADNAAELGEILAGDERCLVR